MAMRLLVLLLATVMAMATLVHGIPDESPEAVKEWFKKLPHAKKKIAELHFFLHDIKSGQNATTYPIAQASTTPTSPTNFGLQEVIDSPLTEGPELDSKPIGYLQGVFTFASREVLGDLLVTDNFVFTDGKYNGSTLAVLGRKRLPSKYREYSIVGGSGIFRLAKGTVTDWTYTGNTTAASPPVEVQIMVSYYQWRSKKNFFTEAKVEEEETGRAAKVE